MSKFTVYSLQFTVQDRAPVVVANGQQPTVNLTSSRREAL